MISVSQTSLAYSVSYLDQSNVIDYFRKVLLIELFGTLDDRLIIKVKYFAGKVINNIGNLIREFEQERWP